MITLFRAVVDHPVATTMMFLAALTFGFVGYQRLPVELMPDIGYPTITVRTAYDGAAPQEVESQVSRPVEESLATLDGLVTLESRSRAGSSDVVLGFDWGTDMAATSQTIRESLQTVWLPQGTDRPLILRYDPSLDPFLRLALSADPEVEGAPSGDAALYQLRDIADREIKRELEGLPGVAAVRVQGGLEREIRIEVREDWLAARQLTLQQVQQALAQENVNISGGSIIEGDVEYLIRTLNQYRGVDELEQVRIRRGDGVLVPLVDVAILHEEHRERQLVTRMNAGEAVQLEVFKEADANVVDVARRVKAVLYGDGVPAQWGGSPGLAGQMPDGVSVDVLEDQAAFIELAVGNLQSTAILGGLLAVGVLFLFLRDFRATAVVGLAIPISVIIGFSPLYLLGVSLNLMSLGGLALGVGMLVDNAVVVLEAIHRLTQEGQERREAAVNGAAEMAAAVTASTLTTVAVFLPIAFVEGVAGELFGDLALAVVSSLLASLAVALLAVPMLSAVDLLSPSDVVPQGLVASLQREEGEGRFGQLRRLVRETLQPALQDWRDAKAWHRRALWRRLLYPWSVARLVVAVVGRGGGLVGMAVLAWMVWPVLWVSNRVLPVVSRVSLAAAERFGRGYDRVAERYNGVIRSGLSRAGTVMGVVALLLVAAVGLGSQLGTELIPELHQGRFAAELSLPVGSPLQRTLVRVEQAETRILAVDGVQSVYAVVGSDPRVDSRSDRGEHTAELRVVLDATHQGAVAEQRTMDRVREALSDLEQVEVKMSRPALFSFRTPVEVVVYGYDLDRLRKAGDAVAARLSREEGLRDVRSSLVRGHPEVRIAYDRTRLHRLGLDPASVANQVRDKVQGVEATRIHRGDERIALLVQLVEPDRSSVEDLQRININPNLRPSIPLSAVADFEEGVGPSEIRRVDQQRAVVVSANLSGFDLGSAASSITAALSSLGLPDGLRWEVAGQSREMEASLGSLQFALGLAIFLVYVIMASTFESLIHPFVILFSVPLALVGAVAGLFVVGQAVSVVVLIGAIVLAGVVVNNAIVLVDTINRQRADGMSRVAAIRRAGALRLRPILITTATTVLGLFPLAFGFGAGAEVQSPLAVTVIGGLLSSTGLTLIVVPVFYLLLDGLRPEGQVSDDRATADQPPVPTVPTSGSPAGAE
ncbi:MAG: efflux RND transporter permease subunit [Myxococcales bacterium]|nr:efflux RND transporter permease subunit [Myxococcales bacterium]